MNDALLAAARSAFPADAPAIVLGAVAHQDVIHPEPVIRLPLSMMNRHGLIAGATGTGKTKTLQLIAEQLSAQGVPVFMSDIKGDLSGIAIAGSDNEKVAARVKETGAKWTPTGFPVEFLSLTGKHGANLRATVSSFGPMMLAKVLDLNETQQSVLSLVFKYCDDKGLLLLDLPDLRASLQYLTEDGAAELKDYGGISKQSVGVLLRKIVELEQLGADAFFGEPSFDLNDLLQVERDGRGLVSVLELADVQDKPKLFSTFLLWMLGQLYAMLPEAGDLPKPKLVFFFDEAHLIFEDASDALLDEIEKVTRLIRSKGVGVFYITQQPRDVPENVLGQLGNRVQHALRAFTPDDEKQIRSTARTIPKTEFYDVEATLTSLGIGQAIVSTLTAKGTPTPPFVSHMLPPQARMGPLSSEEFAPRLQTPQVKKYATAIDRESAREVLAARHAAEEAAEQAAPQEEAPPKVATRKKAAAKDDDGGLLSSPAAKSIGRSVGIAIAGTLTRTLLGALLGGKKRR
jgi:uncharacterized protein